MNLNQKEPEMTDKTTNTVTTTTTTGTTEIEAYKGKVMDQGKMIQTLRYELIAAQETINTLMAEKITLTANLKYFQDQVKYFQAQAKETTETTATTETTETTEKAKDDKAA